jgi:nicotinate-nucleotide adenylyltransferase
MNGPVYYNGTVALEFFRRAQPAPATLGILPAAFNPPTRAHLALARAALHTVDEVLFVLPRVFPHKTYEAASFDQRLRMLLAATDCDRRFSAASSERGLFVEIAEECREVYGPAVRLMFICGRDAAERIIQWDYGDPEAFPRMLEHFELLVAGRGGDFSPTEDVRDRIHTLAVAEDLDSISATDVRARIRQGAAWEHLVPEAIVPLAREIYSV